MLPKLKALNIRLMPPAPTAQQLGYRMPAEWEPLARLWVTPPHNPGTWPNCLEAAQQQFADFLAAAQPYVEITTTPSLNIPTNDSWIRDYGPIFVTDPAGQIACHDFTFNCWGGKYHEFDLDDVVPQLIAQYLQIPLWTHHLVLEGGAIDANGRGTVMTTEQCLLESQRNPTLSRAQIEQHLHDALGTTHTIWLPAGIHGDDTDGHIDDVARFVNPTTVIAARAPHDHPDHATLERNWQALRAARDQNNQPLDLFDLPAPDPIYYNYPPDEYSPGGRRPLPASYANFLLANGAAFAPIFNQRHDDSALRALERALPTHTIIPIRAEHLVVGLGTLHCMTQQQPRSAGPI